LLPGEVDRVGVVVVEDGRPPEAEGSPILSRIASELNAGGEEEADLFQLVVLIGAVEDGEDER
jgi:hypothetical protein